MRLKLIKVMQTPPKSFAPEFKYEKEQLLQGLKVACDIETAIDKYAGTKNDLRAQKFKSIFYALSMAYTENKTKLMNGEITP